MNHARSAAARTPVDPTSAQRQARMRERLGAPVKAHLDPQLRARMEHCAARQQRTLADLLRSAIDDYLAHCERRMAARGTESEAMRELP